MDKYVYLVTPDYMLPTIEESKLYSFFIKAYPSAKSGYKNLINTNMSSILGFIFFYEELPEDLTYLVKFINFINLIGDKSTLVLLAVNNPDGVNDYLMTKIRTDNIVFKYITEFDIVTDSFIKRSLFGTIVLHNFEPYVESINPFKEITTFNRNEPLNAILPSDILSILSPVVKLNNSDNTIKHDIVMNTINDNGLVMYMRINYVKAHFGDDIDVKGMYSRVDAVEGLNKTIYYSVINTIVKLYEDNKPVEINKPIEEINNSLDVSLEKDVDPSDVESPLDPKELVDSTVGEFGETSQSKRKLLAKRLCRFGHKDVLDVSIKEVVDSELLEPSMSLVNGNGNLVEEDLFDYENMFNYVEGEEEEDDLSDL